MRWKIWVGMDLGKRFHQAAAINGALGQVMPSFRVGRGRAGVEKLLRVVKEMGVDAPDVVVTIEATGDYWVELVGLLREKGCCVYLIHPKKSHDLRKFYAVHTKTDITDAEALARMPLLDTELKPVWSAPPRVQTLLRLCRLRWKCRCRIADLKRRISTFSEMVVPGIDRVMPVRYSKSARLFLRRYLPTHKARRLGKKRLCEILSKTAWGKFSEKKQDELWACIENAPDLGWNADDLLLEVNVQLDELDALELQVERLDARIAELYTEIDPDQRLKEIPGIGEFLAAALTAHIGEARRFPNSKTLVAYAGLAPRVKHTAGHAKPGQVITKHGSPFLRAWAYQGASTARQYDPQLKAYYERMRERGKHYNVALCATAARLLERAYKIPSQGEINEEESQDQMICSG
jgi:transposase